MKFASNVFLFPSTSNFFSQVSTPTEVLIIIFASTAITQRLSANIQWRRQLRLEKINKINWKLGSVNQSSGKSRKFSPLYPSNFSILRFFVEGIKALNLMKYSNEWSVYKFRSFHEFHSFHRGLLSSPNWNPLKNDQMKEFPGHVKRLFHRVNVQAWQIRVKQKQRQSSSDKDQGEVLI